MIVRDGSGVFSAPDLTRESLQAYRMHHGGFKCGPYVVSECIDVVQQVVWSRLIESIGHRHVLPRRKAVAERDRGDDRCRETIPPRFHNRDIGGRKHTPVVIV